MKVKEESEKVGLKLNIQKTKIMASGPITSWQIQREKSGNSDRFYFGGSKIKQESSRETSISALLTMPKPLTVWITINCGKF